MITLKRKWYISILFNVAGVDLITLFIRRYMDYLIGKLILVKAIIKGKMIKFKTYRPKKFVM